MSDRTQRRLAAIVSADVVAYSRLMGEDEEGTLAALKQYRRTLVDPNITAHNGRIVKTTGDGLLLEFASVLDAVRCSVEIQRAMMEQTADIPDARKMQFRFGVNIGDIIIDGDDIHGEGVNIAARLEALADPGGVCISDDAMRQIKGKLDVAFVDDGEHAVKNIALPIHVWRWRSGESGPTAGKQMQQPLQLPDKPSIAVQPFDNMSGNPEQEYFADGAAEDIITALSKYGWFFVTARNSSFTYKGGAIDIKQVGTELGVRYVLEGSVRKAGTRVRVTAQLIEAASGNHIWAERYDRELADIFDLQDEITNAVVGAVEPELAIAERDRATRKPTDSLDAWDLYQRGMWHFWRLNKADGAMALDYLERASEMDPKFASAFAGLAWAHGAIATYGWTETPDVSRVKAFEAARRAVDIDDKDAFGHMVLGRLLGVQGAFEDAIAELCRALEINPNFAMANYALGLTLVAKGEFEEAMEVSEKAMRQSPNDPLLWAMEMVMSGALMGLHKYEEALSWSRRSCRHPTAPYWAELRLIPPLVALEQMDEAHEALAAARKKFPDLSVTIIKDGAGALGANLTEGLLSFVRTAGLPE